MSVPSRSGGRPAAGRLDPTVRALLRSFLSPAVADRYTSALQPVAVADRDAAIAGAVSALRVRFEVPAIEVGAVLVMDTGWSVEDAALLSGCSTSSLEQHLEHPDTLRIGPAGPSASDGDAGADDREELDEAALVDAMLDGLPTTRHTATTTAGPREVDVVEMATTLPGHVGRPSMEARVARADRRQQQAVYGTIAVVLLTVALTVDATRPAAPPEDPGPPTADEVVLPDVEETDAPDEPFQIADPEAAAPRIEAGPVRLGELLWVLDVDPSTGDPGTALTEASVEDEVRVWTELTRRPQGEVLIQLTFTAPDGTRTVRPVLLPETIHRLAVRLPEELGREPGRYLVSVGNVASSDGSAEIELRDA